MDNLALSDNITLSSKSYGIISVTLEDSYWSSISNLRAGMNLYAGEGHAVLDKVPQPYSNSAEFQVLKEFDKLIYSEWKLNPSTVVKTKDLLPENVKSTKLLPDYFAALEKFAFNEAVDASQRLISTRNWAEIEPEDIQNAIYNNGLMLSVENLEESNARRVFHETGYFYETSGTAKFIDFLSYSTNSNLEAEQLWTTDYKNFRRASDLVRKAFYNSSFNYSAKIRYNGDLLQYNNYEKEGISYNGKYYYNHLGVSEPTRSSIIVGSDPYYPTNRIKLFIGSEDSDKINSIIDNFYILGDVAWVLHEVEISMANSDKVPNVKDSQTLSIDLPNTSDLVSTSDSFDIKLESIFTAPSLVLHELVHKDSLGLPVSYIDQPAENLHKLVHEDKLGIND